MATHTWPALTMAPSYTFLATVLGSTSSMTMAASLPPSSRVTRFRPSEADLATFLPVAVEPVKATLAMSGWAVSSAPRSFWSQITLSTPGGRISLATAPKRQVVSGVVGAGLATMVLPVTSAGPSLLHSRITGKFHGVIEATTPSGVRCSNTLLPPSSFRTLVSGRMLAKARRVKMAPYIS